MRKLSSFVSVCVLVCFAPAFSGSAVATTSPLPSLVVQGVMSDSTVTLVHSVRGGGAYVSSNGSTATFGRGTTVIFRLKNTGSQSYLPAIKVLLGPYMPRVTSAADLMLTASKVAPPGGRVEFLVHFLYRGSYRLLELEDKKAHGTPVRITIT